MGHKITFLLLLSFVYGNSLLATKYYVKVGGNNSLSGTSIANAWATVAKVNSFAFSIGDSILFEGGSTFVGPLRPNRNGVAGRPMVFTSYGTGQATITGFTTLTGWTNLGGNIWEVTPSVTLLSTCNILTINAVPQRIGRTPNTTFYTYTSASASQLTSSNIASSPSYVGAEVVMRANAFVMQRATITAQTSTTLNYTRTSIGIDNNNPKGLQAGTPNYGFFIQRSASTLDQQGEWYYNPSTQKMRIYSTSNPSGFTIKASYLDTIIVLGSRSYITIDNLAIEGAGLYGVSCNVSTTGNLIVKNCSFNNNTRGINLWNCFSCGIINNTVNNSFNVGILYFNRQQKQQTIDSNTVTNTGLIAGNGVFASNENLCGIVQETSTDTVNNFARIRRNVVQNVGYMAIKFLGSNIRISKNVSDSYCINIDDGGGIYTYNENLELATRFYYNRVIDSNFISNCIGAPAGTNRTYADGVGYYIDDQAMEVIGYHNSVSNIPGYGAQFNNPKNNTFYDNTVYNSTYTFTIKHKLYGAVTGNRLTRNVFYQKSNTQFNMQHESVNLSQPPPAQTITQRMQNMAYIDSNWLTNIKTAGYDFYYSTTGSGYTFPSPFTLASWRSNILHDIRSILPPTTVTNTNTTYYENKTDTVRVITFTGFSKVDPKGNVFNNLATVPAWSSLILIDNGTATPINQFPVANAGTDQTVTQPTSTATLNGSASSDPDGTIILYQWSQISGPSASTIASANTAITGVSGLIAGIYQYQLVVTDNNSATSTAITRVTVNVPPNTPPVASAGEDQSKILPVSTATLTGSGTDPDGTIVGYLWEKISGPSGGNITTPTSATTGVTSLQQGTYAFQLRVTDNGGLSGSDIMNITVNPANLAPVVDAGLNQSITLPDNSVALSGTVTDEDGTIASLLWEKVSGPSGGTISTPTTISTDIDDLQQGAYVFRLTATDNNGASASDFVQVTVNPEAPVNNPPIVNAGDDQTIALPTTTATLTGGAIDPDGTIVGYLWTKISGPSGGNITSSTSASTGITALQQGTYAYQLTATDNMGLTGSDFVQIIVNAAIPPVNEPPTANAGNDTTITLPSNTATLVGSGTDTDGTIVSYAWVTVSGPEGSVITSPTSATTGVTGLLQGTYAFKLTVTDNNGSTASDFVQVIVNAPINTPPIVNAGEDQTIILPTSSVTLTGSATDTTGTVSAYFWSKLSGPSGGTISSPNTASTSVTGMVEGSYIYQLRATDNTGDTATDAVQINVLPANLLPIVSAGSNQIITLPQDSTSVTATASDPDGNIVSTVWVKVDGPSGGDIGTPNELTTTIDNMVTGVYIYRIKVTDNNGDTAISSVQITVNPVPIITAPTANAGQGQTVQLPLTTATLHGSGTNGTGTIISHVWSLFSGPSGGDIATPNNYTTTISNLQEGIYIYQLTVTDSNGLIGTDLVPITVRAVLPLRLILLRGYKQ